MAGAMFSDLSVDEIMDRWPATIRVFIRHDMLCIGCAIGSFHTLGEACKAHNLEESAVTRDLMTAIGETVR